VTDDLESRLQSEKRFHDEKYSGGDLYPAHYSANPTVPIYKDMLSGLESLDSKVILEYGCGDGWCTLDLCRAGGDVRSFDISDEAVRATKATLAREGFADTADVRVMSAEKLDYADETFDIAFGFAILHHLDLGLAVPELLRVLKPGGIGIFAEPLQGNPLLRIYRYLTPQYRTEDEEPMRIRSFKSTFAEFSSVEHEEYYLTGQAALAMLYVPGIRNLYPKTRQLLWSLDRKILNAVPALGNWAWYSRITITK
jgi:SAM-dependent methyltransferase